MHIYIIKIDKYIYIYLNNFGKNNLLLDKVLELFKDEFKNNIFI